MYNICPNCFEPLYASVCEHCGYSVIAHEENHMLLRPGMMLNSRYIVGRCLGAGGFGVTYLVKDSISGTRFAAKEYLPSMLAVRDGASKQVYPSSNDNAEIFEHGLQAFDREAESLRMFQGNKYIVQVLDAFRQNGTAYYIMEFLDGVNLKALTRSMNGRLPPEMALEVLINIGVTLSDVHNRGLLHRDVSPENIFVTKQGEIKLIDFGATRFFVGEHSRSLSVVLKPGFAPPEQYSSKGNQGPWTDVYALAATFLSVTSGQNLPDAPDRLAGVTIDKALAASGLSAVMCRVIDKALKTNYRERYQNCAEFLAEINAQQRVSAPSAASAQVEIRGTPYVKLLRGGKPSDKWLLPSNMDMTIGRASERCNIILDDPDISRIHCTLRFDSKRGAFILTDVSTNGTFLPNGKRLERNVPCLLQPGARFVSPLSKYEWEVGVE